MPTQTSYCIPSTIMEMLVRVVIPTDRIINVIKPITTVYVTISQKRAGSKEMIPEVNVTKELESVLNVINDLIKEISQSKREVTQNFVFSFRCIKDNLGSIPYNDPDVSHCHVLNNVLLIPVGRLHIQMNHNLCHVPSCQPHILSFYYSFIDNFPLK